MIINNFKQEYHHENIHLFQMDCMSFMEQVEDKWANLAVVDPPFGINADINAFKNGVNCKANGFKKHKQTKWDNKIPKTEYFEQLFRVSENQIIWGGNYLTKYLQPKMCWLIWNKVQRDFSFADGELAWTSFDTKLKIFDYARGNESGFAPKIKKGFKQGLNINPCQKPIALYEWILKNYAKPNDIIFDSHLGSASQAIAIHNMNKFHNMNLTFYGTELDTDYFNDSVKRLKTHFAQKTIFD